MSVVEVRDLFRVYSTPEGHAAALQGLTLSVQEKEVLVVLGPSGPGNRRCSGFSPGSSDPPQARPMSSTPISGACRRAAWPGTARGRPATSSSTTPARSTPT